MGEFIAGIIANAEKLGTLSAAGIWAFFTLMLIIYIAWDMKAKKQASEQAWEARIKDADSDNSIANAVEKMADQIKELRYKIEMCCRRKG